VPAIEGGTVVHTDEQLQAGAAGACFALFTEIGHKLVTSAKADLDGRFELRNVAPGRYRLVARAKGLCTANIPLEVVAASRHRKAEILVHFRATGIDTCSYGEITATKVMK